MSASESPSTAKKIRNLAALVLIVLVVLFTLFFALDRAGVLELPFLPREEKSTEPYSVVIADGSVPASEEATA